MKKPKTHLKKQIGISKAVIRARRKKNIENEILVRLQNNIANIASKSLKQGDVVVIWREKANESFKKTSSGVPVKDFVTLKAKSSGEWQVVQHGTSMEGLHPGNLHGNWSGNVSQELLGKNVKFEIVNQGPPKKSTPVKTIKGKQAQ